MFKENIGENRLLAYINLPKRIWCFFGASIIMNSGNFIFTFIVLFLSSEFDLNISSNGLILSIVMLSYIPTSIIGGIIADKYNKKFNLIILRGLSAISLIGIVLVDIEVMKMIFLIFAFILVGLSKPSNDSIVLEMTSESEKRIAYSLIYIGNNIGSIISPILAGILFKNINYLIVFDALSTISAMIIIWIFVDFRYENINSNNSRPSIGGYSTLIKNKVLIWSSLIIIGLAFCYSQQQFSLPLYMETIFNENTPRYYGFIIGINSLVVVAFTTIINRITKNISSIVNLIISGGFFAIGFGLIYFSKSFFTFIVLTFIWSIGEVLFSINTYLYITETVSNEFIGRTSSIVVIIYSLGNFIGAILSGFIIENFSPNIIWIIILIISIISSILLIFIRKKTKIGEEMT